MVQAKDLKGGMRKIMIAINASLYSLKVDKEGEAKITFCVPQSDAIKCFGIPTSTGLYVTVATVEEVEGA